MKTIVRIVALFVLTLGLVSSGLFASAVRAEDAPAPTEEITTEQASPVVPVDVTEPAAPDTPVEEEGGFSPATIGEEVGGDHEEIDGMIRLTSDLNSGTPYAYLSLPVPAGATIAGLTNLGVDFILEADDDCGGGSPRFSVGIDMDGDGVTNVYLYVTFDPCVAGGVNSTGNLVTSGAAHTWTSTGLGPITWADVVANFGPGEITYLGLIVDGGGGQADGEQTIYVQSITGVASAFEGVSNLRVIKTKDTTAGPVVPGACFTIFAYGENGVRGDVIADEQCDDDMDGNVDFVGLPALTALIIAETMAPAGYQAGADFPVTLAEGDNFIGFPNSLAPEPTATFTPTATATATATGTSTVEPTGTAKPAQPTTAPATGTTEVTKLPSTGTGEGSSSSLPLMLLAALMTVVVISGGWLVSKRHKA